MKYKITYTNFCDPTEIIYEGQSKTDAMKSILDCIRANFHGIDERQINYFEEKFVFENHISWWIECCNMGHYSDEYHEKTSINNYLKHIEITIIKEDENE